MILTDARNIFGAARFAAGLEAASRGVVRLVLGDPASPQAISSGWLVTDTLVVVPAFALSTGWVSTGASLHVVSSLDGEIIPVTVDGGPVDPVGATLDHTQPALLRLARPLAKRALPLSVAAPRVTEPVFLLHHPQGAAELMLSWGRIVGLDGPSIRYDADTEAGSGGAPVLSAEWRVLGMHSRSSSPDDADGRYNAGVSTAALLERLSGFEAWREIAAHHALADVTEARHGIATVTARPEGPSPTDEEMLTAAVSWTINPPELGTDVRDGMAALVIDRTQKRWMLRGNDRTRLIGAATLEELRAARGDEALPDLGQRVIDRILAGPPFDLEEIDEGDLPFWLQAVRWFAPVVPALPTPGDVHKTLARRRARSRLTEIAGPGFRGRKRELQALDAWLAAPEGALVAVTGIGGVGKSALVAKLALGLPPETVLLWLDFDRADLAPDDPVSVLSILYEQLSLEVEGLTLPPPEPEAWLAALVSLGSLVRPALAGRPVLLVLDGFEVAQHAPRHEEIWRVLEQFLEQLPGTNVIVSGRAPVGQSRLANRTVQNLHLTGLEPEDAEGWLRDAGVKRPDVLAAVLEMSRGVPLILRLAVNWLEGGGKLRELPEKLPERVVEGFLYQRILDRVVDDELKPVATDILVLRQLTPSMLQPIVGDSLPKGADPHEVFTRLAQEMALVGDSSEAAQGPAVPVTIAAEPDRLILRPEVRAATVHLLETATPRRVKTIDRRAARWYAKQPLDDPAVRAELVYHRLRAGDIKGAAEAWRIECLPFLATAVDELPATSRKARAWLRARIGQGLDDPVAIQQAWEADALGRLHAMLARGLERGVAEVLAERTARAPRGPLVVYDAWVAWRAGDLARAREILAAAPAVDGPVDRDRVVLAARLALAAGDASSADDLLATIDADGRWVDRPQAVLDATTVAAARVRLSIDLDAELNLAQRLRQLTARGRWPSIILPLATSDVVLPLLARLMSESGSYESLGERIPIPLVPDGTFLARIDEQRVRSSSGGMTLRLGSEAPPGSRAQSDLILEDGLVADTLAASPDPESVRLAARIETLAYRRWLLAGGGTFLARACDTVFGAGRARDPQALAIAGTLGAFAGSEWAPFRLYHPSAGPLEKVVRGFPLEQLAFSDPPPPASQLQHARAFVDAAAEAGGRTRGLASGRTSLPPLPQGPPDAPTSRTAAMKELLEAFWSEPTLEGIGVYLLSPDPLDVLVRRVLGVPDQLGG